MKRNLIFLLFVVLILPSCKKTNIEGVDFRFEMVEFVKEISIYAKSKQPGFFIVPQNGEALAENNEYLISTDAIGIEDLSYGYEEDGLATSEEVINERLPYLDKFKALNKLVLVTDYVFSNSEDNPHFDDETREKIDFAYQFNLSNGFIPYATVRNLNYLTINPDHEPIIDTLDSFADSQSFLYYLEPNEISKEEYIESISITNFDIVIMDMTYDGLEEWTNEEINTIKEGLNDGNGGYVLCYISIGEAEDYRYYFDQGWIRPNLFDPGHTLTNKAPFWLVSENEDWFGNFKVRYWENEWKNIIYGNDNAYLDKIISKGFDGVYLDIVDAYEYFEEE